MGDSALCQNTTAVYHPRKPTNSPLYRLLYDHFDHFEQIYDEWFEKEYGFFCPVIFDVVRAKILSLYCFLFTVRGKWLGCWRLASSVD
jgi:hypothetical protein